MLVNFKKRQKHKFLDIGLDGIHFSIDKNKKIDENKISSILEKLAL